MTPGERRINAEATFLPLYEHDDGTLAYPSIVVGGVQVYAYFDEGVLCVSTDYDTADEAVLAEDGEVPTEVSIGGETVWSG